MIDQKYVNEYESSCYLQKRIKTRIQRLIQKTKHQNQRSTKKSYFKFMKNMGMSYEKTGRKLFIFCSPRQNDERFQTLHHNRSK